MEIQTKQSDNGASGRSSGSSQSEDKLLEFFDLPRELRDQIYDETLTNKKSAVLRSGHSLCMEEAAYDHTLLISRRFTQELRERASNPSYLVLEDASGFGRFDRLVLPPQIQNIAHVELHYNVGCSGATHTGSYGGCKVSDKISRIRCRVLEPLRLLPDLQSLRLNLYIYYHDWAWGCEQGLLKHQSEILEPVTAVPESDVRIYISEEAWARPWKHDDDNWMVMKFSQEAGELRRLIAGNTV